MTKSTKDTAMFAVGGILLMVAMGFALSGMISDGGDDGMDADPTDPDALPDEVDGALHVTEGSDLSEMLFGSTDDDHMMAGDGDDTVEGGDGDDWLMGEAGDDALDGGGGADTLDGGDGNDALRLGVGDLAIGGEGADSFHLDSAPTDQDDVPRISDFEPGVDHLFLEYDGTGAEPPEISLDTETTEGMTLVLADGVAVAMLDGTDALSLSDITVDMAGDDAPPGAGVDGDGDDTLGTQPGETIDGTQADDSLSGGPGDDTLDGYAGDDLLNGGTGDDLLRGREGMDSLFGEGGDDAITGGVGDDLLDGGTENDALFGNEGNDSIMGNAGADEAYGDEGNDTIAGGSGTDFLAGGDGDDVISGGAHGDLLFGNDGDDSLSGDGGNDYLQGGFGADTLEGGDGNDRLDGTFAAGDALFGPHDEDEGDLLNGGAGDDLVVIGANDIATGGAGADTFITGSFIETEVEAGAVTDFDPGQDVIEIMYDPVLDPDPVVTIEDFADGTGAHVLFNGQIVLSVTGGQGLDPATIALTEVDFDAEPETA